jgi:hypothetical protein
MAIASLSDLRAGYRLVTTLPGHLRRRPTAEEARASIARRLRERDRRFLDQVRYVLAPGTRGPQAYRELFRWAGCSLNDVVEMVERDGLEPALKELHRSGVYLTVEEFKGREPIRRGSQSLSITPDVVRNSRMRAMIPARTGASRSDGTPVFVDLAFVRESAEDQQAFLEARGGSHWRKAAWGTPGSSSLLHILELASFGAPPERWFSLVPGTVPGFHPRYRWSSRAVVWASRGVGWPIPAPEYAPVGNSTRVLDWLVNVRRIGAIPYMSCYSSSAANLCSAALDAGIDISGSQLLATSEPFSPARQTIVRSAGVTAVTRYGAMEAGGAIGYGCELPVASDDVHLLRDLHAVIQPPDAPPGLPALLYVTSLRPHAPYALINVGLGDSAVLSDKNCGCPLDGLGWRTHAHTIRSPEKLTAGAANFLDADIIRILEETLPRRFGGSALDYQLVEDQDEAGAPVLRLLVSPGLGTIDAMLVKDCFLQAIGAQGDASQVMTASWAEANTLRIERCAPYVTAGGKILHVHSIRPRL